MPTNMLTIFAPHRACNASVTDAATLYAICSEHAAAVPTSQTIDKAKQHMMCNSRLFKVFSPYAGALSNLVEQQPSRKL
jgi:hypothetical protein